MEVIEDCKGVFTFECGFKGSKGDWIYILFPYFWHIFAVLIVFMGMCLGKVLVFAHHLAGAY